MIHTIIKEFISPAIGGGFIFKTLGFIFVTLSSATAFIIKHFYDIEVKMEKLHEGMTLLHEKVDQSLELENQKVIMNQQKEAEKDSFDYSSYLTYNMLFKGCIVIACIVGGVYCYNHFIVSSNVIQTIGDATAVTQKSFTIVNEALVESTKNINHTTEKNIKEGTICLIEALQNSNKLLTTQLNTLSQEMSNGFIKLTNVMTDLFKNQNKNNTELSTEELKILKDILQLLKRKVVAENPNNNFKMNLKPNNVEWDDN